MSRSHFDKMFKIVECFIYFEIKITSYKEIKDKVNHRNSIHHCYFIILQPINVNITSKLYSVHETKKTFQLNESGGLTINV